MKVETIQIRIEDDAERNYYRAIWYLAGALRAIGVGDQVIPALHELFERTVADGPTATLSVTSRHVTACSGVDQTCRTCRPSLTDHECVTR